MQINKLLIIGMGGAGNRQLDTLLSINRRYTGLFFNTNLKEMKELEHYEENRMSYYVSNADGCGQDRILCKKYLQSEAPKIMDTLSKFEDKEAFILLASASGGTGSRAITYLSPIIKKIFPSKSINIVVTLPSKNSSIPELNNAVDTWNEIVELKRDNIIDSIMFIDNNKLADENVINKKAMQELNSCLTFQGSIIDSTDSKRVNTSKGYKVILNLSDDIDNLEDNIEIAIQKSMFYIPSELESNYLIASVNSNISLNDVTSLFKGYDFKKIEAHNKNNKIVLGGCEMPRKAIRDIREAKEELMILKRSKVIEDFDDLKIRTHKDISKNIESEKITNEDLDELFENDDFWNQFN